MQEPPLADDLTRHIGEVCVAFSMVEMHAKLIASKLLTHDGHIAAIVVSETPFKGLVGMIKSLVYYKTEDAGLRVRCHELTKRMTDAEEVRNHYLHSQWMPVVGAGMEFSGKYIRAKNTAKVRHGLHQRWQVYTAKELIADAKVMTTLGRDLSDFDLLLMKQKVSAIHKIGLTLPPDVVTVVEQLRTETGESESR
jgi:hypothetical protein